MATSLALLLWVGLFSGREAMMTQRVTRAAEAASDEGGTLVRVESPRIEIVPTPGDKAPSPTTGANPCPP